MLLRSARGCGGLLPAHAGLLNLARSQCAVNMAAGGREGQDAEP
ncbi:MAG TPA: hypothetical protein VIL18_11865 [Longimicrobiales bacterium]